MKKIISLFVILIVTYLTILGVFHWDFLSSGKIVPPMITFNNCDNVISEIEKYDWDKETAIAVMKAESKCDINSKGDTDLVFSENNREYGYSVGAFQVRILPDREECDTFEIETNVKCAYGIYKNNNNSWEAWSMYKNNEYKKSL